MAAHEMVLTQPTLDTDSAGPRFKASCLDCGFVASGSRIAVEKSFAEHLSRLKTEPRMVGLTPQEAAIVMRVLAYGNEHAQVDTFDRQCTTWVVERIQRAFPDRHGYCLWRCAVVNIKPPFQPPKELRTDSLPAPISRAAARGSLLRTQRCPSS